MSVKEIIETTFKPLGKFKESVKYILLVIVVLWISLLFPKQPQDLADIQVGERWIKADLKSNTTFPIRKDQSLIEQEKNEIIVNFLPIFDRNVEIRNVQIGRLKDNLESFYDNIGESTIENQLFVDSIVKQIDSLYKIGIYRPIQQSKDQIRVFENGTFLVKRIKTLLKESDAENLVNSYVNAEYPSYFNTISGYVNQCIEPNLIHNAELSDNLLNEALANVNEFSYLVKEDEIIVKNGDVIDQTISQKLGAYQRHIKKNFLTDDLNLSTFLGYFLLTCLIIGALLLYLRFHFADIFRKLNKLTFVLLWPVVFSLMVYSIENIESLSSFLIPFCIVPIVVKNFFGERLALFLHIVIVLIASFLSKLGYEFTFLLMLTGIVTVLVVSETRYWSKFFNTILIIFFTYILGYLGLALVKADSFSNLDWTTFIWLTVASLLTLLAYPFIPLLERMFGFTSSISLAELADMGNPLLKEMSIKAPGTLQHSIQVANLSEAAADKIGANSLLIKVAALYHDIGKLSHPEFFIENQSSLNPHDNLSYFESAKRIIQHVTFGEVMAKKAKLPQLIIDFIMSHHGTTRVEYFYRKQLTDFPDREFDEILFKYPGPKPRTKEEAILMLADSLEASSKSLVLPTGQDIDELVEKIVEGKIKGQQLNESALTFEELEKSKQVFKSLLRSINHVRIEYPEAPDKITSEEE